MAVIVQRTQKRLCVFLISLKAIKDFLKVSCWTINWDGGALRVAVYCSQNLWVVPQLNEASDVGIVLVLSLGDEDVDVWLCFFRLRIIFEDREVWIDACAVKEGVVDDGWATLLVSGWCLSCVNWNDGNLGSGLVDVDWSWGDQTWGLQGDKTCLNENVDGAALVGRIVRDGNGLAVNAVDGVVVLPE